MSYLYIDIETIPCQRADIQAEIRNSITAPAQYKKQESIEQWLAEHGRQSAEEALHKTSLDGAFGQVFCVAVALDNQPPIALHCAFAWEQDWAEGQVLQSLMDWLEEHVGNAYMTTFVGHNILSFDLRFLLQRCIVNAVRPAPALLRAAQAKPWEAEKVYDTMTQWAGVGNRVKLDKLCKALSIDTPKTDIDGSKVWEFVQAGKTDEVLAYCRADVEAVRKVHKRMTFATVNEEIAA